MVALPMARQLGMPEPPSYEQLLLAAAHAEHRMVMDQLSGQLASLRAGAPPEPREGDDEGAKARADWDNALYRGQLMVVREDCCFHLPLDHEYGERLDPPEVEHWIAAPGVTPDEPRLQEATL